MVPRDPNSRVDHRNRVGGLRWSRSPEDQIGSGGSRSNLILDMIQKTGHTAGVIADASGLLKEHGLQVTAQRLAVLNAVTARPHGTADDLVEDVRSRIGSVSRQAVFDALGVLTGKGLIRRIQPARSVTRVGSTTTIIILCAGRAGT